jgi:hypothetical protein
MRHHDHEYAPWVAVSLLSTKGVLDFVRLFLSAGNILSEVLDPNEKNIRAFDASTNAPRGVASCPLGRI